ncbi:GNAT family N-acetyltransferase [Furfurilactobacillus cerevisiae]|uniref:GNAT family N-acetyltransferase n=1 Tax=Furfurilactobacillus rossiae TaxID=231049 RepID=UPI003B97EADD
MSEPTVDIRPVTENDAADLLTLLEDLKKESTTFTADPALAHLSVEEEAAQLRVMISSPQNHLMVADYGGQLIGVASIIAKNETVGEIGVAILKSYWNEGLGSALMEEMLYWAKTASSLTNIVLTVQLENTYAKRLYRNLGFKVTHFDSVVNAVGDEVPAQEMTLTVHHGHQA